MGTNWLRAVGLIKVPEGATLQGAELALRGPFPLWLAALVFLIGVAGAAWFYANESGKISPWRRVVLALLRVSLIGLVLLMLMRPVLQATFQEERKRPVLVLLDVSESMTIADRRVSDLDLLRVAIARGDVPPGTADVSKLEADQKKQLGKLANVARLDIVKAALGNEQLRLLEKLRGKGPLKVMLFDRRAEAAKEGWEEGLKATGEQTALADTVFSALARQDAELPAAVVVITDGHDNASTRTLDEVGEACGRRKVPLHIWGVGSTEAGVLELKDVSVPRTVFVDEKKEVRDDPIEVPIRFRMRGFKKGKVVVRLQVGDQAVEHEVDAVEGENEVKVEVLEQDASGAARKVKRPVRLVPEKGEGERPVRVSIRLKGRPDVRDDEGRVVQVKNSRIKVLYVEGRPSREYKFIQPVLNRDRRVLLRVLLTEGDSKQEDLGEDKESGARYLSKFPEKFPEPDEKDPDKRPYDLVVLGDVASKVFGENGEKALQKWVKEGGGLAVLAGQEHMPAEYEGGPLAEVLPVEFKRQEFAPADAIKAQPYRPRLTYDGENSLLLSMHDKQAENLKLWREGLWKYVPGFYWYYPVEGLKPGAVALLVHPEKKVGKAPDEKPLPLIATHFYGKGEVLYVGVEETWRWRDNVGEQLSGDRITARFWGQAVLRLGLPHLLGNARRSQVELEGGEAVLKKRAGVKARLLGPDYEPLRRPVVMAELVNLDDKGATRQLPPVKLKAVRGQPGEYRGELPNNLVGRHELRLKEQDGVQETTLPYRVGLPPRHELSQAGLAEDELRKMALSSEGGLYREEGLHELPDNVDGASYTYLRPPEDVDLLGPLAMALFVILITAEWVLRKFSNLS